MSGRDIEDKIRFVGLFVFIFVIIISIAVFIIVSMGFWPAVGLWSFLIFMSWVFGIFSFTKG